jgi:hypothetical protein
MAARRSHILALSLGLSLTSPLLVPTLSLAADEEGVRAVPEVENSKFQFIGEINTNGIPVRSGPSNNFYSTMKLDKNQLVTVVGMKYDWLKIVPPKGSFSYVPQAYVTRRGEGGKMGRVTSPLNVRAGSSVNAMKTTVQTKLEEGKDVEIIEAQDEYYKIVPPEGAFLYVHKQYVTPKEKIPLKGELAENNAKKPEPVPQPPTGDNEKPIGDDGPPPVADAGKKTGETDVPDTQPSNPGTEGPTTAPAVAAVDRTKVIEEFRKLEADFEAASKQSLVEQPLERLTEGYTKLSQSSAITGTYKQIVDAKLWALKARTEARDQLGDFRKNQEAAASRERDLKTEQKEIEERLAQSKVAIYTAVGTLRVSSIQQGQTMLYRLTDPATGRTVVYIRSNDPKYAGMLNQFVGVTGDLTNDERLRMKIITPQKAEAVDASKVAKGTIIATITPPSMIGTANINDPRE